MQTLSYRNYFDLTKSPFEASPDVNFFFEGQIHGEALARLLYLTFDKGMHIGMITGEIGAGKTLTINVLKQQLASKQFALVHISSSIHTYLDFIEEGIRQLGGRIPEFNADVRRYSLTREFQHCIKEKIIQRNGHLLMIFDEAQMISQECLNDLKCLTNMNIGTNSPITLLFSGQCELKDNLKQLPQVYQRIGMAYHLMYLPYSEIIPYLNHRLRIAGTCRKDIFTSDCADVLHEFTKGCPREVNKICKLAVDRACLLKQTQIDISMIKAIIQDIKKQFS